MQHKVNFIVPERELGKSDIEFKVDRNGQAFGTLRVSKGAILWVAANRTYGYKLGWSELAKLAEDNGKDGHK